MARKVVGDSSEREGAFYRNIDGILYGSASQFLPIGELLSYLQAIRRDIADYCYV